MMRFLALKLIKYDRPLLSKIGSIVFSSNNRIRMATRSVGSATIALVNAFFRLYSAVPYGILIMVLFFGLTENCGFPCHDYFKELPVNEPIQIFAKKSTGNLIIVGNDHAQQVEIYVPSKAADEVAVCKNGEIKKTTSYVKVRKKAKQVKFSDFKRTDPVLSRFKDIEEPDILQKRCLLNEAPKVKVI